VPATNANSNPGLHIAPLAWRIGVGRRVFLLRALMPDQELDSRRSTGAIYWEGALQLSEAVQLRSSSHLPIAGGTVFCALPLT